MSVQIVRSVLSEVWLNWIQTCLKLGVKRLIITIFEINFIYKLPECNINKNFTVYNQNSSRILIALPSKVDFPIITILVKWLMGGANIFSSF